MNIIKHWQKAFFSGLIIWAVVISFLLPKGEAQDIVTSEDISGGSSVFVFRSAKKTPQARSGFRSRSVKSTPDQRAASRRKISQQAVTAVFSQRKRTPKVDPNAAVAVVGKVSNKQTKNPKNNNTDTPANRVTTEQASNALAGAAETYLEKNELDRAIEYFQTALELNPKNEAAKLGLSEVYTRKGDEAFDKTSPDAAIGFYEKAVSFSNQNAAAYAGLGAAYEADEAEDKAILNYGKALALNKDLTSLHAPLGALYFQKGEIALADQHLSQAEKLNPDDEDVQLFLGLIRYRQNRNEEAIAALKRNQQSAQAHYYLGETYDRMGRADEAFAEYKRATAIDKNYLEAWFDLAVASYNRENYEEAANAYKEVLRLKNDYGQAHSNLADTYRQMAIDAKDKEQKRKLFEQANGSYTLAAVFIKEIADPAELYSNWAFCLGRVEKWDNAIKHLNTAVSIKPAASDYSNIGWANLNSALLDKMNNKEASAKPKLENGKAALQKAVALNPKLSGAYVNLGMTNTELGDFQGAVNALKTAMDLRGGNWWVLNHELGYAYRQLNDLENAVRFFKKTTELNKNYADGWYNLGEAEHRRGNTKEAEKAFKELKKINPVMASRLDAIMKGAILTTPQNKLQNKIQQNNPLKKIPKPF